MYIKLITVTKRNQNEYSKSSSIEVGQYYSAVYTTIYYNRTLHRWRRLSVGYYLFIFHLFIVNRTRTRVITGIVCRILWTLMLLSKQFFFRLTVFRDNMSYRS